MDAYPTVSSLPTSPVPAPGTMARVYADPNPANNVFWLYNGGWAIDADLIAALRVQLNTPNTWTGLQNFVTCIRFGSVNLGIANAVTNLAFGENALSSVTTATQMTALGHNAGANETTGIQSSYFGAFSGQQGNTVNYATGVGRGTLIQNQGDYNTAIGANAGSLITTGEGNTFVGSFAGAIAGQLATAGNCTAVGSGVVTTKNNQAIFGHAATTETVLRGRIVISDANALRMDDYARNNVYGLGAGPADDSMGSTGHGNTAVGKFAHAAKGSSIGCAAFGYSALKSNEIGDDHSAFGAGALENCNGGVGNTAMGREAAFATISAGHVTALGDTSLKNSLADNVTAIGYACGRDHTTGIGFCGAGVYAGGYYNADRTTVFGTFALSGSQGEGSTYGDDNAIFGFAAAGSNSGARNAAFGSESLRSGTSTEVSAFGFRAGYSNTAGSKNTFIGTRAGNHASQKADAINSIAIGADSFVDKDNQTVIGTDACDEIVLHGVAFSRAQLLALKALV